MRADDAVSSKKSISTFSVLLGQIQAMKTKEGGNHKWN